MKAGFETWSDCHLLIIFCLAQGTICPIILKDFQERILLNPLWRIFLFFARHPPLKAQPGGFYWNCCLKRWALWKEALKISELFPAGSSDCRPSPILKPFTVPFLPRPRPKVNTCRLSIIHPGHINACLASSPSLTPTSLELLPRCWLCETEGVGRSVESDSLQHHGL